MRTTIHWALCVGALLVSVFPLRASAANTVTIDGLFADWADEYCQPDTACGDFTGRDDAKGACIASDFAATAPSPATTAYLRFDFDATGFFDATIVNGCWLVDVNQNGRADRALCFSLQGSPLTLQLTVFFTCNDSSATTCGNATQVATLSLCAAHAGLTTERLLICGAGDTGDTGVECSAPLADLGWTSGTITLLRGCTYSATQPNSTPSDCIVSTSNPFTINPATGGNTPVELLHFGIQ